MHVAYDRGSVLLWVVATHDDPVCIMYIPKWQ